MDEDGQPEMLIMEQTLAHHPLVNQEVELGEATYRLAIVNLDWDQIKAVDILHMLQGFKPPTGVIESVKIYPSEFGKERLEKEAIEGPPKDIFLDQQNESDDDIPIMNDEGEDFDEVQLRKYQLERLKYFYAVVSCDSIETACSIYRQCDGAEFEMSANFLDIRYIPDSVSFDEDELTDVADHTSKNYKPKTNLITPALQHSKVKLTWDMDDPDRARFTKVNFAKFDYNENDLRAYLASSSSGEESDEDGDPERYRQLLLGDNANVFGRKSHEDNTDLQITFASGFNKDCSDSDDVHMEATFNPSSDDDNSHAKDETVFEARLRRMREKKTAKKEARLAKIAEAKAAEKARIEAERKASKKNKKRPASSDDKQAAELDLLMLDDRPDTLAGRHFDMTEIVKQQKKKSKKSKQTKETSEDSFQLDVNDDRFKAIFEEPAYSIDPSNPAYKPTEAMRSLIHERQRRIKQ